MGGKKKGQNAVQQTIHTQTIQQKAPAKSKLSNEIDIPPFEMSVIGSKELAAYPQEQQDMFFVAHSMFPEGFERVLERRDPWQVSHIDKFVTAAE